MPPTRDSGPIPLSRLLDAHAFPAFSGLAAKPGEPLHVAGLAGSGPAALAAAQFRRHAGSLLVLAPDTKAAEALAEDLQSFLNEDEVLHFPGLDLKPYEWRAPFGPVRERRLEGFDALYRGRRVVMIVTVSAFLEKLSSPRSLHQEIVTLQAGDALSPGTFRAAALGLGFREETVVQDLGTFGVRGEILDIYPYLAENPYRIVLGGDTIESIKEFDIFSQRSVRAVDSIALFPLDECCYPPEALDQGLESHLDRLGDEDAWAAERHRLVEKRDLTGIHWQKAFFKDLNHNLLDFLGAEARVIVGDADGLADAVEKAWAAMRSGYQEARGKDRFVNTPEELLLSAAELARSLSTRPVLQLSRLSWEGAGSVTVDQQPQQRGGAGLSEAEPLLRELAAEALQVYLLCPNAGQAERLRKLAQTLPVDGVCVGHLNCGFIDRTQSVALLTDHQIFNRFSRNVRKRKFRGGGAAIPSFDALNRGDFVVHEAYGIGRFVGIGRVKVGGRDLDCILLHYHGSDKLTLPVADLAKLEKFAGEESLVPVLSKLGGKSWETAKEKTRKAIVVLVKDLIDLYAKRSVAEGFAFSADGDLQREFAAAFEYDLTPDQAKAIADVKRDMETKKPMDRLVCGDVGFGKTEVAMRAAFKAVCDKKQVAILAPTTILAAQHFDTFSERFAAWPVRIEALDRFRSPKEQKATLAALADGTLDLVVGTHRLLSKDVAFKDLGLLIVDEEQKFGVKQKERLKEMRAHVDVLALSATPIPRSLHMSMLGTRDLSIIATPPRNRLPIETRVVAWDPAVVRDALEAELSRGGQAYFVYNRVADMHEMADRVQALVPQARVGVAHGQMEEGQLERVMAAFVHREYDVLACTAIIESGIDIANANTMIIHRADLFGLSQLYQLRGRVGRSAAQAHCLLIAPDANRFTDEAKSKLYALEKYTDLGSGFQIAMRDLEIRGAGNLLGLEQSGHIAAVGFETYCRMLRDAVREMQGQKVLPPLNPEVEFPEDAFLPEDYVEDGLQRTLLYQKLSRCSEPGQVDEMEKELIDRFGPVPRPAAVLLRTMLARVAAQQLGLQKITLEGNLLQLQYAPLREPEKPELAGLAARCPRPLRFLNTEPLQMVVELNPPRSGDAMAAISQAAQILRGWL